MSSLDGTGYHLDSQATWLANLTASFQSIFGSNIDVSPSSPDGQWLATLASLFSQADQRLAAIWALRSPSGATGAALSRLALLTGTSRKPAQFSTAPVTLGGTAGTLIPAGSLVASDGTDGNPVSSFQTAANYTIGSGGTVSGQVIATTSGPILAEAGHINKVTTVISGWTSVTNTADAAPGTNIEADAQLRVRRTASVALPSQGLTDSMQAALGQVPNIGSVAVYENFTEVTDSNGLPPHSVYAVISGAPAAADVATALWVTKGQGCTMVGAQTYNITDAQGFPRLVQWDQATQVPVYIIVKLDVAVGSDVQAAIVANLVAWGNGTLVDSNGNPISTGSEVGEDVVWGQLFIPINLIGGLDVGAVYLGDAPSPTSQSNLSVPFNSIAAWDPSRISVVGP